MIAPTIQPTTQQMTPQAMMPTLPPTTSKSRTEIRLKTRLNVIALILAILLSLLTVSNAFAEDAAYYKYMRTEVLPYIDANLKQARVKAYDGIELNYALLKIENSKGTVFLSPGRSESILAHAELIYELAKAGFSVAAIDHRGQGFSQRLLKSDAGHVVDFRDYVKDFRTFAVKAREAAMPKPYFLLGSSMGAAIGTHFAIVNPTFFKRIAVAAPMYQISDGALSTLIYRTAKALFGLGWGDTLAPSQHPYDFERQFNEKNLVTHSLERFKFDVWLTKKNPAIAVGGPTTNWVLEASKETQFLQANASKIQPPMMLFQAGADSVVGNRAQETVCARAKNCTLFVIGGALHSLFFEIDFYRSPAVYGAIKFFNED